MQIVRLIAVVAALAAVIIGHVQEKRRLDVIRQLPGEKARDYYEAVRSRGERLMWLLTGAVALGAIVSLVRAFLLRAPGAGP